MKQIQKYLLLLVNFIIIASLFFGSQYSVSAQSQSQVQAAIDVVSPPLFSDLTWENLGNVQKDVHVYDQILNLSGDMYAAVEPYQNGIPESVFDYYSVANLESLGWTSVGRSSFESTYWHPSGRYLTVEIIDCPNSMTEYCVNVWMSVDSSATPPAPAASLSAESLTAAYAALNKTSPANGSSIELPTTTYLLLKWSDAGIGSTERYQYCIDETNNNTCDLPHWITRNSIYSGDTEFTLAVGHTYYWQVKISDAGISANSGAWWSFTVIAPSTFSKTAPANAPANGSKIDLPTSSYTVLQWTALAGIASTDRYQYCIDETNNQSCDSNNWITRSTLYSGDAEFTLTANHTYYWQVRARDAAKYANSGTWWSFSVVKASTFNKTTPANGLKIDLPTSTYLFLKWTALSGINSTDRYQYCIDETNDQLCNSNNWITRNSLYSGDAEFTLAINKTYYWQVKTRDSDNLTNNGTWWSFTTSAGPSVSSIVRANPTGSNTSASSVVYTVTFSSAVTGVDISDFALTTTGGVTGAAVSGVSGSGSVYTVTVNTGSGSGTLRLDVIDDDTIISGAGYKLGGTGLGNGNFTSGGVYTVHKPTGSDTAGVFTPSTATFYLRNSNSAGAPDITIKFGATGDYPVVGDWDGNGTDTIGVYRNGTFYLSNSNTTGHIDLTFAFGKAGDQPIAGDWNGDGIDTVGLYRSSIITFYLRNTNSAGAADATFKLGNPGDVGITGDWNADGKDTTGVFRPSNGALYLKNANTTGYADIVITYGVKNDKPVTGDWNYDETTTIGIYRNAKFYLRNTNTKGYADFTFAFGAVGDMPLAGNWDGLP